MASELYLTPILQSEAFAWIDEHHRHLGAPRGDLFRVAVARGGEVVGVICVGRPVARHMQDGWTCEVIRCCVPEGQNNVSSKLYGAAWRAARALGWKRLITYTLPSESGVSLVAAGYRIDAEVTGGGPWNRESRPRVDTHPQQSKIRWIRGGE